MGELIHQAELIRMLPNWNSVQSVVNNHRLSAQMLILNWACVWCLIAASCLIFIFALSRLWFADVLFKNVCLHRSAFTAQSQSNHLAANCSRFIFGELPITIADRTPLLADFSECCLNVFCFHDCLLFSVTSDTCLNALCLYTEQSCVLSYY